MLLLSEHDRDLEVRIAFCTHEELITLTVCGVQRIEDIVHLQLCFDVDIIQDAGEEPGARGIRNEEWVDRPFLVLEIVGVLLANVPSGKRKRKRALMDAQPGIGQEGWEPRDRITVQRQRRAARVVRMPDERVLAQRPWASISRA